MRYNHNPRLCPVPGVVAFLTVALMPLPSVHVTLSMGQPVGAAL